MPELPDSNGLLILPHLKVQNANAISSPLTWGFPAISAFTGLMQALERKLDKRFALLFDSVGVICHRYEAQATAGGFTRAFHLTRNPTDHKGNTPAIAEEGRIHLEITLVFGVTGYEEDGRLNPVLIGDSEGRRQIACEIAEVLAGMRIAGGSVLPGAGQSPRLEPLAADASERAEQFRRLRRRWLPGFALVSRDDLLAKHLVELRRQHAEASELDAWLDLSRLNSRAQASTTDKVEWSYERPPGWIVPIPVGYGALSPVYPAGEVRNARDAHTPLRFVESLYSLGQWISPHRLSDMRDLLWHASANAKTGLYRCHNQYPRSISLSAQ